MPDLSPEDRYQLRKLRMDVDKKALEMQKAQQDLDRLILDLEHKYDLLGSDSTLDPKTGTITAPILSQSRNGKVRSESLLATMVEEAE